MRPQELPAAASQAGLYDQDFFLWTQHMAALLRAGRFHEVDIEHAAEELEDMGKRDLRALNSRLVVLLTHLLKLKMQPGKRSGSWQSTMITQREQIEGILQQSPSLRARLNANLDRNYSIAVRKAAAETGLDRKQFLNACPFTLEQILDLDFLPG